MKRVIALLGLIGLVGIYLATLITAILGEPVSNDLFKASLFCSVVVPVLMYFCLMIVKWNDQRNSIFHDEDEEEDQDQPSA